MYIFKGMSTSTSLKPLNETDFYRWLLVFSVSKTNSLKMKIVKAVPAWQAYTFGCCIHNSAYVKYHIATIPALGRLE